MILVHRFRIFDCHCEKLLLPGIFRGATPAFHLLILFISRANIISRNHAYVGLREVNRGNKNKEQETLKPYQKYQIVKASWLPIIDRKVFDDVQKILDDNNHAAMGRLQNAENRSFLLSGLTHCAECGRSLVGCAGHGRNGVHRYYIHRPIFGKPVTCSVKSIPADAFEKDVLNHLDVILERDGYLDKIEQNLEALVKPMRNQIQDERARLLDELDRAEKDISSAFRLHAEMGEGVVDDLFKDRLKSLQTQKTALTGRLVELREIEDDAQSANASMARKVIESNLTGFKKARKAATPAMTKRLIRSVLFGIDVGPQRAAMTFWTVPQSLNDKNADKRKKAPEDFSGANLFLYKNLGGSNLRPSPILTWDEEVGGSDSVKNGRADWI